MTVPNLIESDIWPTIREKIATERADRLDGLLNVATFDGMRQQQGFIEALDWVVAQAKRRPEEEKESIYD